VTAVAAVAKRYRGVSPTTGGMHRSIFGLNDLNLLLDTTPGGTGQAPFSGRGHRFAD